MRFLIDNALSPVLATLLSQAGHDALHVRTIELPSVIQFRGPGSRKPDALSRAILSNLSQLADPLERGSIVTFEPSRIRVRALPINRASVD